MPLRIFSSLSLPLYFFHSFSRTTNAYFHSFRRFSFRPDVCLLISKHYLLIACSYSSIRVYMRNLWHHTVIINSLNNTFPVLKIVYILYIWFYDCNVLLLSLTLYGSCFRISVLVSKCVIVIEQCWQLYWMLLLERLSNVHLSFIIISMVIGTIAWIYEWTMKWKKNTLDSVRWLIHWKKMWLSMMKKTSYSYHHTQCTWMHIC